MLGEFLKYDSLGNADELRFLLFHALQPGSWQRISDVRRHVSEHIFAAAISFDGMIGLLNYAGFIERSDEEISLNLDSFNPLKILREYDYFSTTHFFHALFTKLQSDGLLEEFFDDLNTKIDNKAEKFYLQIHLIKVKFLRLEIS
jgi:hypothetical protein